MRKDKEDKEMPKQSNRPDSRGPGGPERDEMGRPVHPRGKVRGEDDEQPDQPDPVDPVDPNAPAVPPADPNAPA